MNDDIRAALQYGDVPELLDLSDEEILGLLKRENDYDERNSRMCTHIKEHDDLGLLPDVLGSPIS